MSSLSSRDGQSSSASHPAPPAPGGRLDAWVSRLAASLKALGLGLVGLCFIAYLDMWVYQGVQGLALFASAPSLEAPSNSTRYGPGQSMGWLDIPRLGVSAVVAHGDDARTLLRAVGHIPGTAFPGERGNVGLAGHRDTFLRALEGIEIDDAIQLVMPKRVFSYRVVDVGIVEPSRVDVLAPTRTPSLTLVTCYPFDYVGPAPLRYIVRAEEIPDEAAPELRGSP